MYVNLQQHITVCKLHVKYLSVQLFALDLVLNMPLHRRTILSKLPYKIREQWRTHAHNIFESNKSRALFKDLVTFIDRQLEIMSDPLFGDIWDVAAGSRTVTKSTPPPKLQTKPIKESSYATTPTTTKNPPKLSHIYSSVTKPSQQVCICCAQSHFLEQCQRFTKEKTQGQN